MPSVGRPSAWTNEKKRVLIKLYLCSTLSVEEICEQLKDDDFNPGLRSTQYELAKLLQAHPNALRPNSRHAMKKRLAEMRACRSIMTSKQVLESTIERSGLGEQATSDLTTPKPLTPWTTPTSQSSNLSLLGRQLGLEALADEREPRASSTFTDMVSNQLIWQLTSGKRPASSGVGSQPSKVARVVIQPEFEEFHGPLACTKTDDDEHGIEEGEEHDLEKDEASFWLPAATRDGRLFYINALTGVSKMELPSLDIETAANEITTESEQEDEMHFWIPQATPDGGLFYLNTRTGVSTMKLPLENESTGRISSGDRSSEKYTSSYLDDIRSLLSRFSFASSWRSSKASSVATLLQENDQPGSQLDPLSNRALIESCCNNSHACIHFMASNFVNQCPTNDSSRLHLDYLINVDVNQPDPLGNRLLHLTAKWGATLPVLNSLICAGADVNSVNAAGQTVLHVLDPSNLLKRKNALRELYITLGRCEFTFDARDECGKTVLLSLLETLEHCGCLDLLEELLGSAILDARFWRRCFARDNNGMSVAILLNELARDARLGPDNSRAEWLRQVYHEQCLMRWVPMFSELLSPSGLDLRRRRDTFSLQGRDPQNNSLDPRLFGGVPGSKDDDRSPATLHELAAAASWPEAAETLPLGKRKIRTGVNEPSKKRTKKLANGRNILVNEPSVIDTRRDRINHLLSQGFDIDAYDSMGFTPLMTFIICPRNGGGDEEVSELVQHLLDKGANVHKRSRQDATALHMAVRRGLRNTAAVLLSCGAKLSARTKQGLSVLTTGFRSLRKAQHDGRLYGQILACMMNLVEHGAKAEPNFVQEWLGRDEPATGAESLFPVIAPAPPGAGEGIAVSEEV